MTAKRPRRQTHESPAADQAVGRAIKVLRTARGLGRRELAERAGVSYPYLAEIENGAKAGSPRVLRAIGDALEVPLHELMAAADELTAPKDRAAYMTASLASPAAHVARGSSWFRPRSAPHAADAMEPSVRRETLLVEVQRSLPNLSDEDLERVVDLVRRLVR